MNGLNDVEAGKFAKRICKYEFDNAELTDAMTDKEVFYWSNISGILAEVKVIERQGRISKKYNLRAKHFTFYDTYYNAMKLLNDRQCGVFVKANLRVYVSIRYAYFRQEDGERNRLKLVARLPVDLPRKGSIADGAQVVLDTALYFQYDCRRLRHTHADEKRVKFFDAVQDFNTI